MSKCVRKTIRTILARRGAYRALATAFVAACTAWPLSVTNAALVYYEPFDYTVGETLDQQATWDFQSGSPANSSAIQAGSLAGPAGLNTAGNHAYITAVPSGTVQLMSSFPNIAGNDGDTTWISFIAQRTGEVTDPNNTDWPGNPFPRGVNVSFFDSQGTADGSGSADERISIGNSSNAATDEWSVIIEGSGSQRKGNGDSWGNLHWAVLRIDHHGDQTVADDAYLWLDPDPNTEPALASAYTSVVAGVDAFAKDYSNLDLIRPFLGGQSGSSGASNFRPAGEMLLDEIRIGTTYADMNATGIVPEPTTALLSVLALLGLSTRRSRD